MTATTQSKLDTVIAQAQADVTEHGYASWDEMTDTQRARLEVMAARLKKLQLLGAAYTDVGLAPELEAALLGRQNQHPTTKASRYDCVH